MAEKLTPPYKKVPKPDGLAKPSSYSTLTTPEPAFGRYFGSGKEGKDVVGGVKGVTSIMGKDSKH